MKTAKPFRAFSGAKTAALLLGLGMLFALSCSDNSSTSDPQTTAPPPAATVVPLPTPLDSSTLGQQAIAFVNDQKGFKATGFPVIVEAGNRFLIAISATCETIDGFKCAQTFFFLNETFLRTDTSEEFVGEIQVFARGLSSIEIQYRAYSYDDEACCPSITGTVTYWWTSSFLQVSGVVPLPGPEPTATAVPTSTIPPTATTIVAPPSGPPPGPTQEPVATVAPNAIPLLQSVGFQSASVTRGESVKLVVTIANTARLNAVLWRQPDGQITSLGLQQVARTGNQYTVTIAIPSGAQIGTWQISEIQVTGGGSANYTFFAASQSNNISPCPTFQNLGAGLGCTTSLLDTSAKITVRN